MKKFFGENVRFVEDEPPEWTELDYSIQVKYDGELSWSILRVDLTALNMNLCLKFNNSNPLWTKIELKVQFLYYSML